MKKIIYLLLAIFTLTFVSCGEIYIEDEKEDEQEVDYEIIPRDTIKTDITITEDEKI